MDNNTIPPEDNNNDIYSSQNQTQEDLEVDELYKDRPSVGSGRTKVVVALIVLSSIAAYTLYSMLAPKPKEAPLNPIVQQGKNKPSDNKGTQSSVKTDSSPIPQPPSVPIQPPPPPIEPAPSFTPPPVIPTLEAPTTKPLSSTTTVPTPVGAPPPPPPPPVPPPPAVSKIGGEKAVDKNAQKRIRSNMLIVDGGKGGSSSSAENKAASPSRDPNSNFAENVIRATTAETAIATGLSNLNMTIAQGKIINAVLETAINTDLPGTIRAIVSRDTYAEAGRDILIPKGSRLLGTYNTGILRGQNRVMIVWTRLIRPDGVDIMIGSPGVDNLGRAGLEGFVDNKFTEIFSAAILTSALTIAGAVAVDAVLPSEGTTTTTPEGNSTTTTSPAQQAAGQAVTELGSTAKDVVSRMINIQPTVTIDQGTRINVFVNRDLTFPNSFDGGVFIQ